MYVFGSERACSAATFGLLIMFPGQSLSPFVAVQAALQSQHHNNFEKRCCRVGRGQFVLKRAFICGAAGTFWELT